MFIHDLDQWPHFVWDNSSLARLLASVRHQQGRHLGRMESLGFELRAEANLLGLTSEVVRSSAIEGEVLDPDDVRSSLGRRLGLDVESNRQPSRDVEGAVAMMLDATLNAREPLTVSRLHAWHAALFPTGRSGMQRIEVGAWRRDEGGPMAVVSGPIGREKVHFQAPDAKRLDLEVARFLEGFEATEGIDPVLKAAVAHLWFVTIHPYDDGNGRIARAISDLALSRADGTKERFYSLSSAIADRRKEYYAQLESAQRGTLDITAWIDWFLNCLAEALTNAETLLDTTLRKAELWRRLDRETVNERQRKVINLMLDGFEGKLTTAKYAKLTRCSTDSALRDLKKLVEVGVLRKSESGGRSTSYRLVDSEETR